MYIYWLVVDLPPCKIWVRQIGSSQLLRKIKFMFQTTNIPPTSKFCGWKWLKRVAIHRDGPHNTINSSNHTCSTQKTSVIIHLRWWINSMFFVPPQHQLNAKTGSLRNFMRRWDRDLEKLILTSLRQISLWLCQKFAIENGHLVRWFTH